MSSISAAAPQGHTGPRGRVFLLSPANCGGARARQVLSPQADFALANRLRSGAGAPLGELFAFVSGLYFRGKLTYARRFAVPPDPVSAIPASVQIITPNAGLRSPDTLVTGAAMRAFADTDVHPGNAAYRRPLERSAHVLAREIGPDCDVVLLGSIASPKYVDVLLAHFRRPAPVSHRVRRPRRHEPRGAAAAKSDRRSGTGVRPGRGRRPARVSAPQASGAPAIGCHGAYGQARVGAAS